jgi:ATP-dependent helicase/nuclease subunit B
MEQERARTPFRVAAREARREVEFGGVRVHVQIDRIDELPGGGRLLLDYKTGASRVQSWFTERPDEPQLPVYALTAGSAVAGVAFMQVKRGATQYLGLADPPEPLPGAKPFAGFEERDTGRVFTDRAQVFASWRSALEQLGRRFAAGEAAVDPKQRPQTCRVCGLAALCRVDSWGWSFPDGEGDGDA